MQLPQPIARLMNEIFSGKNPADLARIGITTITLVLTLLAATTAGSSTPNDDGSSNDVPAPEQPEDPGYTAPLAHVQAQLDTIQFEVYQAVNNMRETSGTGSAFEYQDRSERAQNKAETNAVSGREDQVDENISMVQAHLPLNMPNSEFEPGTPEASGYDFVETLRRSKAHYDVLMDPLHLHMGVGIAYSAHDDTVWLVIQFE